VNATIVGLIPTPKDPQERQDHFETLVAGSIELLASDLSQGHTEKRDIR
jgi:hypothetical protein